MRIVCWQTILMNIIPYSFRELGKMLQNLSSAAVLIGALRVIAIGLNAPDVAFTSETIFST